jgi:GNAT superfamily N-acetyltransferase
VDFRIEPRTYDDPDVVRLVAAVQAVYVVRYGGPDAAAVEPGEFEPPAGLFLVGILDGEPAVTGGWRRVDQGTVEIKRMYVLDAARRRGLARLMLAELEATAVAAGADRVELNTGDQQPEAIALYESSGYQLTRGFGHYACTPGAIFYGKTLVINGQAAKRPASREARTGR